MSASIKCSSLSVEPTRSDKSAGHTKHVKGQRRHDGGRHHVQTVGSGILLTWVPDRDCVPRPSESKDLCLSG